MQVDVLEETAREMNRAINSLTALREHLVDLTKQEQLTDQQIHHANSIAIQAVGVANACGVFVASLGPDPE